jgi:hypothetical protein
MDVIKTVWDVLTSEKISALLALINSAGSVAVPIVLTCFTHQQNKRQKEQQKREQAVSAIAAIAYWISLRRDLNEAELEKLQKLVWQATLWLPDNLAKKFNNMLAWKGNDDARTILYEVRTYIRQDDKSLKRRKLILRLKGVFFPEKEVFEKDDIVFFPPPPPKEKS